jgi:hypothetical protein
MIPTTLYVFTEEPSAKKVFEVILPKLLPENIYFRVFDHQGKQDLENAIQSTVPSISKIPGARILITRDQDNSDCKETKKHLQKMIEKSCSSTYLIRIACRELEAWFLGDLNAVKQAYPRFKPEQYSEKADFRDVDLLHRPDEWLLKIIPEYSGMETLSKVANSENIAPFMDLEHNSSVSFNNTISGIRKLISA